MEWNRDRMRALEARVAAAEERQRMEHLGLPLAKGLVAVIAEGIKAGEIVVKDPTAFEARVMRLAFTLAGEVKP